MRPGATNLGVVGLSRSVLILISLLCSVGLSHLAHANGPASTSDSRPPAPLAGERILFIGNSYTYYAKLPRLLAKLTRAGGAEAVIEHITGPGLFLADHLANPKTLARIDAGRWDRVILQDQSLVTLQDPDAFMRAATALAQRAQAAGAHVWLFETWARAGGHEFYDEPRSRGGPKQMQAEVRAQYARLARATGARVIPIGRAMLRATQAGASALRVYDDDGSHPSSLGALLGASVVYAELTGRCPPAMSFESPALSVRDYARLWPIVDHVSGTRCSPRASRGSERPTPSQRAARSSKASRAVGSGRSVDEQ